MTLQRKGKARQSLKKNERIEYIYICNYTFSSNYVEKLMSIVLQN